MKMTRYETQGGVTRVHSDGTYVEYGAALAEVEKLHTALEQCLAYITRKESHKGCMSLGQIKKAEADFIAHVDSISCGHHTGEGVTVDLHAARAALAASKEVQR